MRETFKPIDTIIDGDIINTIEEEMSINARYIIKEEKQREQSIEKDLKKEFKNWKKRNPELYKFIEEFD